MNSYKDTLSIESKERSCRPRGIEDDDMVTLDWCT